MEKGGSVPAYTVRPMRPEEIPQVLQVWKDTGLSEGTHTLDTWYQFDPDGFFVAVTEEGEILGVCCGILQNEDLAFIGLYAVKPCYRGKGIGIQIWKAVMSRVGQRKLALNAVPAQLANYRDRSGFYIQVPWGTFDCYSNDIVTNDLVCQVPNVNVRQVQPKDPIIDDISRYDSMIVGFCRSKVVHLLIEEGETVTMVATRHSEGAVCGYGTIKKCITGGALVGPLYADNYEIAELILKHLIESFPLAKTKGLNLMIIDKNKEAMKIGEKLGLRIRLKIGRLYNKEEVAGDISKVFSQHDLNFAIF